MAKRINIVRGSAAGTAEISPIDYLGQDFRAYVSACSGSRFDGNKRCQVAQVGDLARIAAALQKAGFQVVADPTLIAAVQEQVQAVAQDVSQADARADAVDAKLRERGLSLFPFQRSGVRWLASRKGALLGDDMGCGKTVQALVAAPQDKPILVVCPAVAKGVWAREAKKWRPDLRVTTLSGRGSFRWPEPGEMVAVNYDILPKDLPPGCPAEMTTVADECFPADTMIATTRGNIRIGEIVDGKMNVDVFSRDGSGNVRAMPVVRWIRRRTAKAMVRVNHDAGSFVCTEDHKIWTEEHGYRKASELQDCTVRRLRGDDARLQGQQEVLLHPVLEAKPIEGAGLREKVRDMRGAVHGLSRREDVCCEEVLREKVLGYMENEPGSRARGHAQEGMGEGSRGKEAEHHGRGACEKVGVHDGGQEPIQASGGGGEDVCLVSRTDVLGSRRERSTDEAAGCPGTRPRVVSRRDAGNVSVGDRTFDTNEARCWHVREPSACLQGRHRERGHDARDRGRREDASDQEVALPGSSKGIRTVSSRVESVEILERGDRQGSGLGPVEDTDYVYDLEVAEDHNYFADGVLVSNCHNLKNGKAQRTQRWNAIAEEVRKLGGRTWLLTATPILNNPFELWAIFSAAGIEREAFGSWNGFIRAFNGVKGRFGYEFGGASAEVPEMLRKVSLRRKKTDVLKDLPAKIYEERGAELPKDAKKACDAALEALDALVGITPEARDEAVEAAGKAANEMAKGRKKTPFEKISEIRALLASAKVPAMLEIVEEHEEAEEPLVVFSAHRMPIDLLAKREGWAVITGDTSAEERTRIETDFQAKKLRGVGCTIKAGGVAITLTRASRALFVDQEWTPALNQQAEDRIYRIGQTRGVVIIQLIGDHALDARLAELIGKKTTLIDTSVEAARRIDAEEPTVVAPVMMTPDQAAAAEAKAGPRPIEYAPGRRGPSTDEERDALSVFERVNAARGWTDFDRDIGSSFVAQSSRGLSEKQWALMVKIAAKYTRQATTGGASRPVKPGAPPEIVLQVPRPAANAVETWAIGALQSLADSDLDYAQERNNSGFNKFDGGPARSLIGRYLSSDGKLSPRDWDAVIRIAKHYPRQVGRAPGDDRRENPVAEEVYRVECDGEAPITTTWGEFYEANRDGVSAVEMSEIHGLYVGDSFTGGGGAMPEWTITRIG